MDARRVNIMAPHEQTCEWLFEKEEFKRWEKRGSPPKQNNILWIKGKPGAGKSTLMKSALKHIQHRHKGCNIAAYFFNARGTTLEKTPLGMLRSLLYQLVEGDEQLFDAFLPLFQDKRKKQGELFEWHIGELGDFLLEQMKGLKLKPIILLIDALDECTDKDVRAVASFLQKLNLTTSGTPTSLKICLSSRHYPHVTINGSVELKLDHEERHRQDISKFVRDQLVVKDGNIESKLLEKSNGVFMWVVLVVERLNRNFDDGDLRAMSKALHEIPSDLDELFLDVLSKGNEDKQATTLMLQWVLFALRPLRPRELYFAVLIGSGENVDVKDLKRHTNRIIELSIKSTSRGLIEVSKSSRGHVQFIHESIRDFLQRNRRIEKLDPTLENNYVGISHDRLVRNCVACLSISELDKLLEGTIRYEADIPEDGVQYDDNITESTQSEEGSPSSERHIRNNIERYFPFPEYASAHLLSHAEAAQKQGLSQVNLLLQLQVRGFSVAS
jgi:NACHT domain